MSVDDLPQFGDVVPGVDYTDRPGVYALVMRDDSLLVVETASGYFLPGGGIDANEFPEDALRRELLEETGYVADGVTMLATARQYVIESSTGSGYNKVETYYLVDAVTEHAEPTESDYFTHWLSLAEAQASLREEAQSWAVGLLCRDVGQ